MKKIILSFEEFGDMYTDMLPWLNDIDLETLVFSLVDDINGIGRISKTIGFQLGKEDYSLLSNTLKYLCSNSTFDVSLKSMDSLKLTITKILKNLLRILVRHGRFADVTYSVDKVIFTGRTSYDINNLTLVLSLHPSNDYGKNINKLIGDIAYEVLDAFSGNRGNKRANIRSRRKAKV